MLYKGKKVEELTKEELVLALKNADNKISHLQVQLSMYKSSYGKVSEKPKQSVMYALAASQDILIKADKSVPMVFMHQDIAEQIQTNAVLLREYQTAILSPKRGGGAGE